MTVASPLEPPRTEPKARELAERVGFEPTVEFPLHTLSKRAPSTTRPSLRLESITYERAKANCVRPPNVRRSLTGFFSITVAGRWQRRDGRHVYDVGCADVATRLDKTEDALHIAADDVVFSRVTDEDAVTRCRFDHPAYLASIHRHLTSQLPKLAIWLAALDDFRNWLIREAA